MTGVENQNDRLSAALDQQERLLQEGPSFLAVLRGPDHLFEFANEAYLRLIGRPCVGRTVAEVLPEAEQQGFLRILDTVFRSGRTYHGKEQRFDLVQPDSGEVKPLLLNFQYRAMRDLDGRVCGIYAEGTDASHHAELEAAIDFIRKETERHWAELEVIYERAPIGLALLGAEHLEFRRVNRVQAEFYDLPPEQLLGRTIRETTPDIADSAEALLFRVAAGDEVRDVSLEGELPGRPGVKRSWIVGYTPIRLPDGTIDAIICTALETTELRLAERVAQQNEKLAAVGRLAASIAHEINNPLEAVTNLLYLAKHGESLHQAIEYLELAESELRRVAAITTQTLRFHRQTSEPLLMACTELMGSALGIYQGRLTSAGVQVMKRKRAHQSVLCFDGEIRQVLNNLIGNATDALTSNGGTLLLRSREGTEFRSGRPGLWLTVADTGGGMPPDVRKKAFDPFFSTKGIGGTGLGLWISREIMARHQGRLLLRSSTRPGHSGTVASMFLPFDAVRR